MNIDLTCYEAPVMSCKVTGVFNLRNADVSDFRRSETPFFTQQNCKYIWYSLREVPAVLELSGRNQLKRVTSTLTGKSNSAAAMFNASFLLAMTLSSAILRTNLHITAFGLLKLLEEEPDE